MTDCRFGMATTANMAITATATINSMSVNPDTRGHVRTQTMEHPQTSAS